MRVGAIDCGTNSIRLLIADSTTEVVDGVEKTVLKDVVREMRCASGSGCGRDRLAGAGGAGPYFRCGA